MPDEEYVKPKKKIYDHWWFWTIVVISVLLVISNIKEAIEPYLPRETDEPTEQTTEPEETEVPYDISGVLELEFIDNKMVATITTNVADGAIFDITILDSQLEMINDSISIENGKGTKEFEIPLEWQPGYIAAASTMYCDSKMYSQPDSIKEVYGENGEKLEGDHAVENSIDGYNISLEVITVPYPDEATVVALQNELLQSSINELISISEGLIINIQPYFDQDDWSITAVTVSDSWYYSQEYEKERFAEQVGQTVETIIKNSGKVDSGGSVSVYFIDAYNKELASPKIWGGYKIKG